MALATSYLEKHDSDALKFAPWQMNVNDIAKTLATKTAYWKQGASRVNARYQKALGLNLVTEENKDLLKNYVTESEKAIKQLSGQELSNPDVQEMGIKIFKNLFEDQDIVGEDFVVGSLKKEQDLGEQFRTTDGGKNYNPLSVQNIQSQQVLLRKDNQRGSWKKMYNDLEKYTPYQDVSEEYSRLLKNLQAETNQTPSVEGEDWYIKTDKTVGVSKERIKKAIDELGSPQLKQQMRVEGRNTFYNKLLSDPASIDGYYQAQAANLFNESLTGLGNNKAELEYALFMTPEDKKFASKRNAITKQIGSVDETISTIKNKSMPDYIKSLSGLGSIDGLGTSLRKIDALSEQVGINQAAEGLSYQSRIQTLEENPAKIAQENIALSTLRLNETKRHNLETEATARKTKKDEEDGKSLFAGLVPGAQDARGGTSTETKLGDDLYSQLSNQAISNDLLQEGLVSAVMGHDNTWKVIQTGVNQDKRLGQIDDLNDNDFVELAKFMKAYDQGHVLPKGMEGIYSGSAAAPKSIDDVVSMLKYAKVSQLKNNLNIVLNNPDFVKNTAAKLYAQDPTKVNQFSALYDIRKRDEANMSGIINKSVQQGLGDYARLFPSDINKFIVNETTIGKAWEKLPASEKTAYYKKSSRGLERNYIQGPVIRFDLLKNDLKSELTKISKEEYDNLRETGANVGLFESPLKYEDFKKDIEDRTKKSLVQYHRTNLGKVVTRGFEAKDVQPKAELVTMLNEAAVLATNNKEDATQLVSYINSHTEDIIGMNLYTPTLGDFPQVKVKMKVPDAKDGDNSNKLASKVNEFMFDVASSAIPDMYKQKSNPTQSLTTRNAKIVRSDVPGGGTFEVINNGTGGKLEPIAQFRDENGTIVPYITVINPETNQPVIITKEMILQKIRATGNPDQWVKENTTLQANLSSLMNSWKAYYK